MSYAIYSRDTATAGGTSTSGPIYYAPMQDCYLRVWEPTAYSGGSGSATPPFKVMMRFHGGAGVRIEEPNRRPGYTNASEILGTALANEVVDSNYVLVNVESPMPGSPQRDSNFCPNAYFPIPIITAQRAIQYVKDHYDDTVLWGAGNSIDPTQIYLWGVSYGAWQVQMSQLVPSEWGLAPYYPGNYPSLDTTWTYKSDPKVRGVYQNNGLANFVQVDPAVTPGAITGFFDAALKYNCTAYPGTDPHGFNQIPAAVKRAASPYWHLEDARVEHKNILWYNAYGPAAGSVPYTGQSASAIVSGLIGADDNFFGGVFDEQMTRLGLSHRTRWGDGINVNSGGLPALSGAALAADVRAFFETASPAAT